MHGARNGGPARPRLWPVAAFFAVLAELAAGAAWAQSGGAPPASARPVTIAAEAEAPVPVPGLRRVFKAGFEEPVTIVPSPGGRQARLLGIDVYGSDWSRLDHVFELVAPGAFGRLVSIGFDESRAVSGRRSLHLKQIKEEAGSQARLQFFGSDKTFGPEIFTRRYYYVPSSNLATLAREQQSVSIAGTRESRNSSLPAGHPGADFSMPLYLVRRGSALVFAQAIVDYSAGMTWSSWTKPPKGLLTYGEMTPCPLDRWFRLDIYIMRDRSNGKIKVWLDDRLVIDLNNVRTKNDTDFWFTKLADVDSEPAPFESWVDDVEVWSR